MLKSPCIVHASSINRLVCAITITLSLFFSDSTVANDADLNELSFELSEHAQNAINSGVKITIDCAFANIKHWLFLSVAENTKIHKFTISRHTLSNRYVVKRDDLSTPHMFRSIPEAMNYIGSQALGLMESYTSFDSQRRMRISLNKFELPAPMRLQAFLLSNWDLDTGWLAWDSVS
ncbi:MAG: DUF4390 domain-containing protein [Acidiferrobacterales bacterium]|nr:DUF4390 domain-containing protein [Acidiferrobacterales bacterium]